MSISGYSHKQQVLLEKILDQMFNFEIDSNRFEIFKEEMLRSLRNFNVEQPYQHAVYYLALLLTEHAWTKPELIDAVSCKYSFLSCHLRNVQYFFFITVITVERLQQYVKDFLARMHVECFIHGNIDKQKTLILTGLIEQKLLQTNSMKLPLLSRQLLLKREYKLATGERYLFETKNEFHKSSCAELYLQCGTQSDRSNIFIDMVAQVLSEPCYNTLRTKVSIDQNNLWNYIFILNRIIFSFQEQLGYIVFCGARKANGVQGIRFIVQSAKHPAFVEERIECFLSSMVVSCCFVDY